VASRDEELQKTLLQLESGRRQLESLSKQGQMVESALIEVATTIKALNSFDEIKEGTEILVSLGANTFVKASLKNKDDILVGVGAGVSVEKNRADAIKALESRREELTKTMGSLQKMSAELESKVMELSDAAESMVGKSRQ
jgi:prefoldin alpha subunit